MLLQLGFVTDSNKIEKATKLVRIFFEDALKKIRSDTERILYQTTGFQQLDILSSLR